MNTFLSLLRGINVSGQKKIKMEDLRKLYKSLGFQNVQTYIQSGNVVFESTEADRKVIAEKIEIAISKKYNFDVPVLIETPEKFKDVLEGNPFSEEETKRLYVTFLDAEPNLELIKKLKEFNYSPEKYVIVKDVIYFFSPIGYGRAKMNNNFFERKLKVSATTRNWKTTKKLLEMTFKKEINL
jgi:uncharacterized protein (DUF1697 family)